MRDAGFACSSSGSWTHVCLACGTTRSAPSTRSTQLHAPTPYPQPQYATLFLWPLPLQVCVPLPGAHLLNGNGVA